MRRRQTPSQTVGPFFAFGLTPAQYGFDAMASIAGGRIAGPEAEGERIRLQGRVFDAGGEAVPDAMVEVWQADARGRYPRRGGGGPNAAFSGFGRVGTGTDPENRFVFETVKPGAPGNGQAPHLNLVLFMRGMPSHAFTRVYFEDEGAANAACPALASVPAARRGTLVARRAGTAEDGAAVYVFDIRLRGEAETVFFDV